MKNLVRAILTTACLSWPVLALGGEKDVKASFLLLGGIGGVLIGAGLYAFLLGMAAVVVRRQAVQVALFGLSTAMYSYIQYWSLYFFAIATRFLRTRQMRYEFGEPTLLVLALLVGVVAWALAVAALALWLARRRARPNLATPPE